MASSTGQSLSRQCLCPDIVLIEYIKLRSMFLVGSILLWNCTGIHAEDAIPLCRSNVIELVGFDGGEFLMGCPTNPPPPWSPVASSLPEHVVRLSPFSIARYPITLSQFCEFLNAEGLHSDFSASDLLLQDLQWLGDSSVAPKEGMERQAVRGVSDSGAEAFCEWLSSRSGRKVRLPTEAEWEYVAKGTEGRTYPWGETQVSGNTYYCDVGTAPHLATPAGVHDMNGPVSQWCMDRYDPEFYVRSPLQDPVCSNGTARVVRGGPMFRGYSERLMMPATWKRFQSIKPSRGIGFRVVIQEEREVKP